MYKCSFGRLEQHTWIAALETARVLSREAVNVSQHTFKTRRISVPLPPIWGWLLAEFKGFGRDLRGGGVVLVVQFLGNKTILFFDL